MAHCLDMYISSPDGRWFDVPASMPGLPMIEGREIGCFVSRSPGCELIVDMSAFGSLSEGERVKFTNQSPV